MFQNPSALRLKLHLVASDFITFFLLVDLIGSSVVLI